MDAGFICNNASVTKIMLRDKIKILPVIFGTGHKCLLPNP
jgi:hypothetical protein